MTRRAFFRRVWVGGAAVLASGSGGGAYAHLVEPNWPAVERVELPLRDLSPALVGLRVVQLTDVHHSSTERREYLEAQIQRVNALQPDVVVLTGDYITAGNFRWCDEVAGILGALRARIGTLAVLGNHDFGVYSPFRQPRGPAIGDYMHRAFNAVGIDVLRNETRVLEGQGARLQFVGMDDLWSGMCDPDAAFAKADPNIPTIALAHNPDTVTLLGEHRADWLLCGHTHGGQVRIPLWGAPILPVQNKELDAGAKRFNGRNVYVNRGIGCLIQVRFNCRPEIALFTLTREA